jgi:tRNA threonylcarbamoyladenosine biosynthesis protein TsaE
VSFVAMTGYRTTSVDGTRALGAAVAPLVRDGDLVLLVGDLGAGKTAFTQGLASALEVDEPITSPTFTLVRSYEGRLPLHHLDVYRLENVQEAESLAIGELLEEGVTVIEWGDTIAPVLPADYLEVRFSYGEGDDDRQVDVRVVGPSWSARLRSLASALEAWSC